MDSDKLYGMRARKIEKLKSVDDAWQNLRNTGADIFLGARSLTVLDIGQLNANHDMVVELKRKHDALIDEIKDLNKQLGKEKYEDIWFAKDED